MFGLGINHDFHLYSKPTDMRKSFNGLCGLIAKDLVTPASNGTVYIFINKARDKVKLLHWQNGGFVLYYKRLEQGRFELTNYDPEVGSIGLDYSQLVLLIDGVFISNLQRKKRYELAV
jgi:transposase